MDKQYLGFPLEIEKIAFKRQISMQVFLNSTIKVTTGKLITQKQVLYFLEKHKEWIEKVQGEHSKIRKKYPAKQYVEGELFPYLGNERPLKLVSSSNKKIKFKFFPDHLLFHKPEAVPHRQDIKKALVRCYEQAGRKWLNCRVEHWQEQMQLYPKKVSIRSQKTRWGSCSSEGNISLNWRLLAAPLPVMDYVVIHELAHLKHQNHSKNFWSLVENFDPHYKYNRQWLRTHQWAFDFLAPKSELHLESI